MNKDDPQYHSRHSMRLKGYDYDLPGAYFVTIVSWKSDCIFGEIKDGVLKLNPLGCIIQSERYKIPQYFFHAQVGAHVVMPNHMHGIVIIEDEFVGATRHEKNNSKYNKVIRVEQTVEGFEGSPKDDLKPHGALPGSLGAIIGQLKSRVTRQYWAMAGVERCPIWQRNYYDHIIRNEHEYDQIVQYIEINPTQWEQDQYHPFKGVD